MSELTNAIESKKTSILAIQSTLTEKVNAVMKNGILAKVSFHSDTVTINLQDKDLNWLDFLTIRFEQKSDGIRHSYSHGTGPWNDGVSTDQALEATILMFQLCEIIFDKMMDEYPLMKTMWKEMSELSMLNFKKRDEEYAKAFEETYAVLEAQNNKITFDEVIEMLRDNIKVPLVYASRQGGVCNVFVENRGYDGRLNIYIGTEHSTKADLKCYVEGNEQMFLANDEDTKASA